MKPLEIPKIFVSYSWSNPEHEELVLDLSKSLIADGIEILLDKWELREGSDPIAFMESMVNDPSITKIIMIIDSKYTERANSRKGGVGTESTILSNELYSIKDKNKIVAVIAEPSAKPPIFYAGRLYIDLSDQDRYAEEYEKLVRWAFDQYKYEKPQNIGTPPSFITEDSSIDVLHTNIEYRIAIDALQKGKPNASGSVKTYLSKLDKELQKLSVNNSQSDELLRIFSNNLQQFQPHLLEFKKIIEATCSYSDDSKIHKHFRNFFEHSLNHLRVIPNTPGRNNADIELFEFIIYQCFLSLVAILLKHDEFKELAEILDELFIIPDHFYQRLSPLKHTNYSIFRPIEYNIIENGLKLGDRSPLGLLLKELGDNEIVSFAEIAEADIFLYIKSIANTANKKLNFNWLPNVGLLLQQHSALRVFLKSEKPSYFNEVKNTLGCNNFDFINTQPNQYYILDLITLTNQKILSPKRVSMMEIM